MFRRPLLLTSAMAALAAGLLGGINSGPAPMKSMPASFTPIAPERTRTRSGGHQSSKRKAAHQQRHARKARNQRRHKRACGMRGASR